MAFDFKKVEEVLRCPQSKSRLVQRGEALVCTDPDCRLRFEIRDEIPVMLIEDAKELSAEEWNALMEEKGGSE